MKLRNILTTSLMFASTPAFANTYICEACSAGTYSEGVGACKTCPAGTYSGYGASECKKCQAGTYASSDHTECMLCPAGFYCPQGSSSPKKCPAGHYCPQNSSSATKCSAGTFAGEGAKECSHCPDFHWSDAGATGCGTVSFSFWKDNPSLGNSYTSVSMSLGTSKNCSNISTVHGGIYLSGGNCPEINGTADDEYDYLLKSGLATAIFGNNCNVYYRSWKEMSNYISDHGCNAITSMCLQKMNQYLESYKGLGTCYVNSSKKYPWTDINLTACRTFPCNFAVGNYTGRIEADGNLYVNGEKILKVTVSGNHTLPYYGGPNPADAK